MNRPLWKDLVLLVARSVSTVVTVFLIIIVSVSTLGLLWEADLGISDGTCNIAVLPVEGILLPYSGLGGFDLVTTPQLVRDFVAAAEADTNIEGILVEINSPGGTPVASHQVAELLRDSALPVVGLAGDQAASGGYMVAAASDFLIASPMSDIGSIGVSMSYVENAEQNENEGLTYVQLVTGEFKDTGSPERAMTERERERLQQDLDIIHDEFVSIVSEYRSLDRIQVEELADGSTMPGRSAVDVGLVDALGGRTQAQAAMAGYLDVTLDQIIFCEYQTPLLPI